MPHRTLTRRHLNRALLARQLLLERSSLAIPDALDQVGGLQAQYAPSAYVGLWTRLRDFRRDQLTSALEERIVVQATLMRVTIHIVSAREFWLYALGVRRARRNWALRTRSRGVEERELEAAADRLRAALAGGPRTVRELGELAQGFVGDLGLWVDLVRVPPSGTWEHRRADRLARADQWLGESGASEDEGLAHLARAYFRGFGPARLRDIASWAGLPVTTARRAEDRLDLVRYRDEEGGELVDLANAELPDLDTPAPVRFLAHWDASLLAHARRTGILPEEHRARIFSTRNPFSVGTYLVDGRVAGAWSMREGRIVLEPFEALSRPDREALEAERAALEAFHA